MVQGSSLSPLLCNLYLHPLDQALTDLGDATGQQVRWLRYADDLLLLGRNEPVLRQAMATVRTVLDRLRLRTRSPLKRGQPIDGGIQWLGVVIRPRPDAWGGKITFGYHVPDDKVRKTLHVLTEMTAAPSDRLGAGAFNLGGWIVSINDQLRQWHQAYMYADNGPSVFRAVDEHSRRCVQRLLRQVTGIRGSKLYDTYQVRLPRGFWTWQVDGARLVQLSALAPRSPSWLTRQPEWQRLAGGSGSQTRSGRATSKS